MGAEPWSYFVPYQPDIRAAMHALQEQEFAAGRFHSRYSYDKSLPPPASIDDLRARYMNETGTRSILDMMSVADEPAQPDEDLPEELRELMGTSLANVCTVVRVSDDRLRQYFGTTRPTREAIEENADYFYDLERGCGLYIIAYKDDHPHEIFFAGYSFD
jgi:hypothetical protein